MELGILQKEWIARLRSNPEKQMTGCLGKGNESIYRACCLGEAVVMLNRENAFIDRRIALPHEQMGMLDSDTSITLGLFSTMGSFEHEIKIGQKEYTSLVSMNDGGISWTQIADIMEKYPELIFKSSK